MFSYSLGKIFSTLRSSSFIMPYTISELNRFIIVAVGLNSEHSIPRVQRICKIALIILTDILFPNLSLIILSIENASSTAAFEKGRLNSPRTSFDIFPYLLFPPASVNSLILARLSAL